MNTDQTMNQTQETHDTAHLDVLKKITLAAILAFVVGWALTIIASITVNYYDIPNMGEVRVNSEGEEYYYHYYPDFRDYAVKTANAPMGSEVSKFDQMGYFGTGLYIYSISNAYHWMLELKISNFGIIILFPFFCIMGAMILAYLKWIPKDFQRGYLMVPMSLGLAALHTVFLLLFMAIFAAVSDPFTSVYGSRYVYSGQILGTALPSAFIILSTNLFYGAVAGALLQMLVNIGLLPETKS